MTRKHYELFAKMLREIPSAALRLKFAEELVKVLASDNPRFNEDTFRKAANAKINADREFVS
jgi:hypothetical protein